ncbi:SDR family NAD(P)-dependent oxidoreductase [Nitrobacter sp. TKz-YC02]|uniref:SDR family NAD(P)-dependent oxidoreductase n=1 Tax=Nitrobacter sp. TKz-YC02 TaxID=3398704 RepID=UPI003CF6BB8D
MTPRRKFTSRNVLIALHDLITVVAAVLVSCYFRFDDHDFALRLPLLLKALPYFLAISCVIFYVFNLTTTKWRFISLVDALNIVKASSLLAFVILVFDYVIIAPNLYGTFFLGKKTIILYWLLQIFLLAAARFTYRYFRYKRTLVHVRADDATPAIIVGRAADAEILLRSVESGAVKQLRPVCLLSPSAADIGQTIRGVAVLGGVDQLEEVITDFAERQTSIKRIIMTPSAFEPDAQPETVLAYGRKLGLKVSRLPSLGEGGEIPRLTPVAVEDLLLRPSRTIDYERLEGLIKNKSVVVTGGGGSIGSEICKRVVTFGASRLLIVENSEPALYAIVEEFSSTSRAAVVEGRIADIRDRERLMRLMNEFKPDIVFHAAALKHVPILERDWGEGVKTNIFGSVNVADAALASGAESMVMISTDKAIEPVSMLGLTKRFAEMYCQALDRELAARADGKVPMRLISVRFGNVLASNGSVVPKFKAQIEAGGPVTVTHPDMVRYFMTIREACDLVLTAASHAAMPERHDVSVYVLNMGQPVKIVDLAERMISLSGLQPYSDIEIVFTGARPGERLNEILFASQEPTIEIGLPGILAAKPNEPPMDTVREWVAVLKEAVASENKLAIRSILKDAVPEFGAHPAQTSPLAPDMSR